MLKVYRNSEYEFDHEDFLNKIDTLIENHNLEQRIIVSRKVEFTYCNIPHMINLFALHIVRSVVLQMMLKIKDIKILEHLNNS